LYIRYGDIHLTTDARYNRLTGRYEKGYETFHDADVLTDDWEYKEKPAYETHPEVVYTGNKESAIVVYQANTAHMLARHVEGVDARLRERHETFRQIQTAFSSFISLPENEIGTAMTQLFKAQIEPFLSQLVMDVLIEGDAVKDEDPQVAAGHP
jgi:hypothetical protein